MLNRIICRGKVRFTVFTCDGKQELFLLTNNGQVLLIKDSLYRKYLDRLEKFDKCQFGLLILKNNYN
jgi:hypothetical protein